MSQFDNGKSEGRNFSMKQRIISLVLYKQKSGGTINDNGVQIVLFEITFIRVQPLESCTKVKNLVRSTDLIERRCNGMTVTRLLAHSVRCIFITSLSVSVDYFSLW